MSAPHIKCRTYQMPLGLAQCAHACTPARTHSLLECTQYAAQLSLAALPSGGTDHPCPNCHPCPLHQRIACNCKYVKQVVHVQQKQRGRKVHKTSHLHIKKGHHPRKGMSQPPTRQLPPAQYLPICCQGQAGTDSLTRCHLLCCPGLLPAAAAGAVGWLHRSSRCCLGTNLGRGSAGVPATSAAVQVQVWVKYFELITGTGAWVGVAKQSSQCYLGTSLGLCFAEAPGTHNRRNRNRCCWA
jgi:hypothetical protein